MNKGRYEFVGGFPYLSKGDHREKDYGEIKKETGISPDETWALDQTIAVFLVPRLKAFKKYTCGYPGCLKSKRQWLAILTKMQKAFELIALDKTVYSEKEQKRIEDGLNLFREYFRALWW